MTDRIFALTVILEKDIREDDAAPIIAAIKQLRGVLDVGLNVADPRTWMAEERALRDVRERVWYALNPGPGREP